MERLICHYDLVSHAVRLKNTVSKQKYFLLQFSSYMQRVKQKTN
jgi:hypothetical protein